MQYTPEQYELLYRYVTRCGITRLSDLPSGMRKRASAGRATHDQRAGKRKNSERQYGCQQDKQAFLRALLQTDYRRSQSKWAGGEHTTKVRVFDRLDPEDVDGPPAAFGSSEKIIVRKSGGRIRSGTNSTWEFRIPRGWRLTVAGRGLAVLDGLLTLSASLLPLEACMDSEQAYEACWVIQKRGFSLGIACGLIYRAYPGADWIHAQTLAEARRVWARRVSTRNDLLTELAVTTRSEIMSHDHLWTASVEDSYSVGNCATGTASWIERWTEGKTTVRGEVLRRLAEASGERRAWLVYWWAGRKWHRAQQREASPGVVLPSMSAKAV